MVIVEWDLHNCLTEIDKLRYYSVIYIKQLEG